MPGTFAFRRVNIFQWIVSRVLVNVLLLFVHGGGLRVGMPLCHVSSRLTTTMLFNVCLTVYVTVVRKSPNLQFRSFHCAGSEWFYVFYGNISLVLLIQWFA